MHDKHPNDSLDFLYEELPPEAMEQARAHLAECEECREETAAIRDLVKRYRSAPPPALPPNFAETVAARALELAEAERAAARTAPEAAAPVKNDAAFDALFDQMKQDVLAESPRSVRSWLFHPAWTVAASVLLLCTVLIYISPRRDQILYGVQSEAELLPAQEPAESVRERQIPAERTGKERIPTLQPRMQQTMQPQAPAPAPFGLREADAWNTSAGSAPMAVDANGRNDALPALKNAPAPYAAPAAAPAPHMPEASLPAAVVSTSVPAAPPPVVRFDSKAAHSGSVSGTVPSKPEAVSPPRPARVPAAGMVRQEAPAPASALAQALEENVPVSDLPVEPTSDSSVVVEMPGNFTPPQLIARPTPIDTGKLARDLAFLAGMQIGNDEFYDAWITIGLLRKYDTEKADELTALLIEMEKAAENETAAKPAPAGKYSSLAAQTPAEEPIAPSEESLTEPEAMAEPVAAAELVEEPQTVIIMDPPAEPVQELTVSPMAAPTLPVQTPDVPKTSPDAFPPTLGESSEGNSGRVGQPKLFRPRSAGRGVFTTDPYWRRD